MSYVTTPVRRHALGLPAGSIRALLALGVVALICAIVLMPAKNDSTIPPYLIYLLFLMLGHFFAAHGVTIATREDPSPSPLYLPGGTVRFLIILGLVGCIGWKLYQDEAGFQKQFESSLDALKSQPFLPLVLLGAFFVGAIVRGMVGRDNSSYILHDFEAWVALLAFIGLAIAAMIHLVISPTTEVTLMIPIWDACLGGVIAFYFGERS